MEGLAKLRELNLKVMEKKITSFLAAEL